MTAQPGINHHQPGLWDIHSGHIRRGPDGPEVTTTVRARKPRAPGTRLIGWAGWLLAVLGGGILAVSYQGQFDAIFPARHGQVIASNIEAGMFDVGMVIFALLALGLSFAGKQARVERACVLACAAGSAVMNYSAADVASPRSVAAFLAPPLFLALVVDRVIAVVRRWRLGDDEGSPWAPAARVLVEAVRVLGLVLLYTLRLCLDPKRTPGGLRRVVLNAAPLPEAAEQPAAIEADEDEEEPAAGSTKKDRLIWHYTRHPGYGDRDRVSAIARELAPHAGLQAGTARTYLYAHVDEVKS